MRYKSGHKEKTRSRVLDEAAGQLLAAGPEGVHVADIMLKAGLTHGGFYAHFASKDELIVAAIRHKCANSRAVFQNYVEGRSPADGMRCLIDGYLSTRHRDAVTTGCPMPRLWGALPNLSREARDALTTGLTRSTAIIARQLKRLGHPGATDLARSIVAELVGTLSLARVWGNSKTSNNILRNARSELKRRLAL